MEYDVTKTVPKRTEKSGISSARGVRAFEYNVRLELVKKMKEVDKDVNFFSVRPLSHEFLNFVDGKRTISDIADAAGYEYGLKIKGEHVLLFLLPLKEKGYLSFYNR